MESVSVYIQRIEDMLSKMEDIIESSRSVPFSNKVSLDKHAIYDIIDDLRPLLEDLSHDLPNEISQAKRIISDGDKIISDARSKAAQILQSAEIDVNKRLNDHEIMKQATSEAEIIMSEAKKSARDMRVNAMEYADEILATCEQVMREALDSFSRQSRETEAHITDKIDIIFENRQQLRGIKK